MYVVVLDVAPAHRNLTPNAYKLVLDVAPVSFVVELEPPETGFLVWHREPPVAGRGLTKA